MSSNLRILIVPALSCTRAATCCGNVRSEAFVEAHGEADWRCQCLAHEVGNSKLIEAYQGKIYHLCCDDCPKDFRKKPDKFAKAVAADPVKYVRAGDRRRALAAAAG